VFKLTIRATATSDFDHTTAPASSGECATTSRAEGSMTVHFGTRRPVLVGFVGGRLQAVRAGPLDGTAVLFGTNEVDEDCAATQSHLPESCSQTTRTFRNAATSLHSPSRGTIAIGVGGLRLRPVECPSQPDELRQAPLGRLPQALHVSTAALASTRTARITLTASTRRVVTYGPLESGHMQQRSTWTLTFVRVR